MAKNRPHPSLLDLPDDLMFRVLSAASPQPFPDPQLKTVCKAFLKVLVSRATALTLDGPMVPEATLERLKSAGTVRRVDITGCEGEWPLKHVLPHLPHVQTLEVAPTDNLAPLLPLIPASMPRVLIASVDLSSHAELDIVVRLQDHCGGRTLEINEVQLADNGHEPFQHAKVARWGSLGVRTPIVRRALVRGGVVPGVVWRLTSLRELRLIRLRTYLLDAIAALSRLELLEIRQCGSLSSLPAAIGALTALKRLVIKDCPKFSAFPAEIAQLHSLEELSLEGLPSLASLASLEGQLGHMPALECIHLSGCKLQATPREIGRLTCVTTSWYTRFVTPGALPAEESAPPRLAEVLHNEWQLSQMQLLKLASQQTMRLAAHPEAHALASLGALRSVRTLDISLSPVSGSCPAIFGQLRGLTTLTLRDCVGITEFHGDWSGLADLQELRIEKAEKLAFLPEGADSLISLRCLSLQQAGIRRLPQLGRLSSLEQLDLSVCSALEALPVSLARLPSLQYLYLDGCASLRVSTKLKAGIFAMYHSTLRHLSGCTSLVWELHGKCR